MLQTKPFNRNSKWHSFKIVTVGFGESDVDYDSGNVFKVWR
jgi:hypothetical protein